MDVITKIKEKAKAKRKRVLLPEGTEERMIQASKKILEEGLAEVTLLDDEKKISELSKSYQLDTNKVKVINPSTSSKFDEYVKEYYELRKKEGNDPGRSEKNNDQSLILRSDDGEKK